MSGKARMYVKAHLPGILYVCNLQGELEAIKLKDHSKVIQVVRVMQALNGNMAAWVVALEEKANTWMENIRNGWLNQCLAWQGLRSMIWPSLAYPLWALSISWAQGDQITQQLYQSLLPELGLQ